MTVPVVVWERKLGGGIDLQRVMPLDDKGKSGQAYFIVRLSIPVGGDYLDPGNPEKIAFYHPVEMSIFPPTFAEVRWRVDGPSGVQHWFPTFEEAQRRSVRAFRIWDAQRRLGGRADPWANG